MGQQTCMKCYTLQFICVTVMILGSLVTGKLQWSPIPPAHIFLNETTPIGTIIGFLRLENGAGLKITSENSYVTVRETSSGANFVQVNIILNTILDYDYGLRQLTCIFKGINNAWTEIETWQIELLLRDENDETPRLLNQPYSVYVPETSAKNTVIYAGIMSEDPDMNDRLTYTLTASPQIADKDTFTINSVTGQLILLRALDFETTRFYQYTVTVTDLVGHNSSADVFITVIDVQDTPPYFTGEPFQATVWENALIGTSLIKVMAADGDKGVPNAVTLSIINETCNGLFQVDPASGIVSLKSLLDRDAGIVYSHSGICNLVIQATEDNQHPQSSGSINTATTSVTITIMDVNDNAPMFSQQSYTTTVDENTPQGAAINFNNPIIVTDRDQGSNALFEVKVTKLEDYFEAIPSQIVSTGNILIRVKNSAILDYEIHHSLQIELEAKDAAGSSTAMVTININNINDNSPVFHSSNYVAIIPENAPLGTIVIAVTASDADLSDSDHNYGTITYTLEGSDSTFKIDSSSGLIRLNGHLDLKTKYKYNFIAVAEDGSHRKAYVSVEILIADANNGNPTHATNTYQTSVHKLGQF